MKTDSPKFVYRLLDAAFVSLITGFLCIAFFTDTFGYLASYVWPYLTFSGAVLIVFSILARRSWYVFFGVLFLLSGSGAQLVINAVVPYSFSEWWPFVGIFAAVALAASGWYKYRRFRVSYTIPALMLFLLGCFFLLFSLHVISVSFKKFFLSVGPFIVLVCCALMLCFFLFQKKRSRHRAGEEP
ncbi:MAG: hypothetical protein IJ191_02980 [Treponema sp.]|nr:hypothetical protein [Treponema sp.]